MEEHHENLKQLYIQGVGLKDYCENNHLDYFSALSLAKLENWDAEISRKKELIPVQPLPIVSVPYEAPLETFAGVYEKNMAFTSMRLPEIMNSLEDDELIEKAIKLDALDKINRRNLRLDQVNGPAPAININLLNQGIVSFTK